LVVFISLFLLLLCLCVCLFVSYHQNSVGRQKSYTTGLQQSLIFFLSFQQCVLSEAKTLLRYTNVLLLFFSVLYCTLQIITFGKHLLHPGAF